MLNVSFNALEYSRTLESFVVKVYGPKVNMAKVYGAKVNGAKVYGAKVDVAKVYGPKKTLRM